MLVSNYISKDFAPAKANQTVEFGLGLIERFNLTHIPVFKGINFIGNLSKETLEENEVTTQLGELKDFFEFFFVDEKSSLLDAIQIYHNHASNILVVLNEEHRYSGLLLLDDTISGLSVMPLIIEPGSLMIVEIPQKKLSFSEISQIVEGNNARLIGLFVISYHDDNAQLAIKLSAENLSSVGETFERFEYRIIHKFFNDEKEELMKDRYDQLMKYLDI